MPATRKRPLADRRRRTRAKAVPSNFRPAPDNHDRSLRALQAVNAYLRVSDHNDEPEIYCDLIADLGHLCESEGLDFEEIVRIGFMHWEAEREEAKGGRT